MEISETQPIPMETSEMETTATTENTEIIQENVQMDAETRPEAIHLIGVSDLSQEQVQEFGYKYTRSPFAVEWINDNSLNLAFDTPQIAKAVLRSISTQETKETPIEELRPTLQHPSVPEASLTARIATITDVKASNAAKESKYYQKHGAPSLHERRIRFGTDRSEPMKYSRGDILKRKKKAGSIDLFPHLAKDKAPTDDLFPHLVKGGSTGDDLFPHLVKNGGVSKRKGNKRGGRSRKATNAMEVEDLFPNHGHGADSAKADGETPKEPAEKSTVYSNMDY